MKAFKLRLDQALRSGAALALLSLPACGGSTTGSGGPGQTSSALDPYPTASLGCSGPEHDGGYYGQCCAKALCYTPEDGADCVAPEAAPTALGKSYGSGSCMCGETQGPFASNPAHQPAQDGTCCYVISSITCEGRPLLVDGEPVVAELSRRADWISSELLELLS